MEASRERVQEVRRNGAGTLAEFESKTGGAGASKVAGASKTPQPSRPFTTSRISSSPRAAAHLRQTKSESQSVSPGGTRIPRPGSAASSMSQRRPRLTLGESFRLAELEEMDAAKVHALSGSPSPAPRIHVETRGSSDEGERLPELVPGIQDMPVGTRGRYSPQPGLSPQRGTTDRLASRNGVADGYSPRNGATGRYSPRYADSEKASPEKSFAWQVDDDFTAGDLQVSSSPRIKANSPSRFGQQNTKLAEIRAREIFLMEKDEPMEKRPVQQPRANMPLLEELRARKTSAEQNTPGLDGTQRPKNTKLDDIRRLESMEQNSMARSLSPEEALPHQTSPPNKLKAVQEVDEDQYGADCVGEPIPHTPVTVYKKYRGEAGKESLAGGTRPGLADKRSDSQESPRKVMQQSDANDRVGNGVMSRAGTRMAPEVNKKPSALVGTKNSSSNKENDRPKPSVGFSGLRRTESIESTGSKHSDMDAVTRIEAEMKLFAPHDTHSERGSVRAPSPATTLTNDDEGGRMSEATPRATRADFASMPTPRVTGAYVETPMTAKRGRAETVDHETASDPGTSDTRDDVEGIKASLRDAAALRRRRRSRSVPRQEKRVQNSAQPVSVRQDLQDMRRLYNIEDSTVDDVDEVLRGLKEAQMRTMGGERGEGEGVVEGQEGEKDRGDGAGGEALYTRMARSLRSIRFAKRGIERLEDEYSRVREGEVKIEGGKLGVGDGVKGMSAEADTETRMDGNGSEDEAMVKSSDLDTKAKSNGLDTQTKVKSNTSTSFQMSSSTRRITKWRLPSLLTALLSLLFFWYAAETTTCSIYCRPQTCGPATPRCEYTPSSPLYFGTALPIKLDEWLLSGRARPVLSASLTAAGDWLADAEDLGGK
ncbi:hypothetical protein CDD81_3452 [Ophiocordyceps australis]|uniref:Uncharacterized protein n=1 Tax=Ophiocordyceps australis TaxID=1399860 RepID=A0A2C5YDK2_9HYPO|nr:hypothetical protein CDD81_3452 [Ophiocordyceps australis]